MRPAAAAGRSTARGAHPRPRQAQPRSGQPRAAARGGGGGGGGGGRSAAGARQAPHGNPLAPPLPSPPPPSYRGAPRFPALAAPTPTRGRPPIFKKSAGDAMRSHADPGRRRPAAVRPIVWTCSPLAGRSGQSGVLPARRALTGGVACNRPRLGVADPIVDLGKPDRRARHAIGRALVGSPAPAAPESNAARRQRGRLAAGCRPASSGQAARRLREGRRKEGSRLAARAGSRPSGCRPASGKSDAEGIAGLPARGVFPARRPVGREARSQRDTMRGSWAAGALRSRRAGRRSAAVRPPCTQSAACA